MPTVLFICEAVTLAHVARPAALREALDPMQFDSVVACAAESTKFLSLHPRQLRTIGCIGKAAFAERLERGVPLYSIDELNDYVATDLALLHDIRPALVVGDFRLSLSISARLAGVPYASVSNAYWSPYASDRRPLPLPVLPRSPVRLIPLPLANWGFSIWQQRLLAAHADPVNAVRRAHDLAALPRDLRTVYTDADYTLYADSPTLFPLAGAPANHRAIGPVLWSPPVPLPTWWRSLPKDRPVIYVTMGSSGSPRALASVVAAVATLDASIVVSTAGATLDFGSQTNVWAAAYLPGEQAAARSCLVICNGGSPTSQQALAAGVPVIGVCENMDQMLNMRGLVDAGIGIAFRADTLSRAELVRAAVSLLKSVRRDDAAWRGPDARAEFARFVDEVIGARLH